MAYDTIAPILLVVYTSLAALGLYTREAGQGNLEFLFSLPIKRLKLIAQTDSGLPARSGNPAPPLRAGVILGALSTGLKLDFAALTWATFDLFLLSFCVSGLAYLLSLTNDYSRGVLLVLGMLLGVAPELGLGDSKSLLPINPYHYFNTAPISWISLFLGGRCSVSP